MLGAEPPPTNGSRAGRRPTNVDGSEVKRRYGGSHGDVGLVATGRAESVGAGGGGSRAAARADGPRQDRVQDLREEDPEAVHPAVQSAAGDRRPWGRHDHHHPEDAERRDPARRPDADLRLQRHRSGTDDPGAPGHPAERDRAQRAAGEAPELGLRVLDVDPPARLGLEAAVRRLRQRHHPGRPEQDLPVPEQPGVALALVPRPRRAPHRRERLHGPGRDVPHERRARGLAADPEGQLRPAGRDLGQDVRRQRQPHVRRRGPLGPLRRRHAGQRPAVAEPAGRAAQVPLPDPQRLPVPRPAPAAEQHRRPDDGHRHRRRAHAQAPEHHAAAGRHGRALRGRHRLREDPRRHEDPAAQPGRAELPRLRQHRQGHAVRGHRERWGPDEQRRCRRS